MCGNFFSLKEKHGAKETLCQKYCFDKRDDENSNLVRPLFSFSRYQFWL